MYSPPDWDDFDRLGLGDYDEMAPPAVRTRQQTRAGRRSYETIRYQVSSLPGEQVDGEHVYRLDYEPSVALEQAISQQGKNIGYDIDVEHGENRGVEYVGFEFNQKVTVWIYSSEAIECSCGHQVQTQEGQVAEACEHIYFVLNQITQSVIKSRIEFGPLHPRPTRRLSVNKAGTVIQYDARNEDWRGIPPFETIGNIGPDQIEKDMRLRRTLCDAAQFIKKYHDLVTDCFHGLDGFVLLDHEDEKYRVDNCATALIRYDQAISLRFNDFGRDDRLRVVPLLLYLLHGVVMRNREDIGITQQVLPSRNLYGLIIQNRPLDGRFFVIDTLSRIPRNYITEEQRQEKQEIYRLVTYLNAPLTSRDPAWVFGEQLRVLWP